MTGVAWSRLCGYELSGCVIAHCPLPRRGVWAAVSPGLPEGRLTQARVLCGGGLGRQGPLSERVCDGSLSGGYLPPRSRTQRRAVATR